MLNLRKIIRILPITFIFMYAIGVFGTIIALSSRNMEMMEVFKLFSTYSLIPAFLVTIIFSIIQMENKKLKLLIYAILFIIAAIATYLYLQSTNYSSLEMIQNFVLFPILFVCVLGIVFYELKYLNE